LLTFFICLLFVVAIKDSGNPFTEPQFEYDVNDIRSTNYDSFRLAQEKLWEEFESATKKAEKGNTTERIQESYHLLSGSLRVKLRMVYLGLLIRYLS